MEKKKTLVSALLVMILWGSLFPMVKLGNGAYGISGIGSILYFAGVRFTICGVAICIYALLRDRKCFVPAKKVIFPVLLSGVFSIILHYACTYTALTMTDSSKTAILKQVGVLFYVCFAALFFKDDRLTVRKLFGALLGFGGIFAINTSASGFSFGLGDALIIGASFCTVFANVISKKVFAHIAPVPATGIAQLFGGLVLLFVGRYMGGTMTFRLDGTAWIFVYICIASVISYCIWFTTVKNGALSKLFIIKFAEPVFAAVFGALLLNENIFKWQYLLAFVLIAGGIYISQGEK